jgi:hypothetical protein
MSPTNLKVRTPVLANRTQYLVWKRKFTIEMRSKGFASIFDKLSNKTEDSKLDVASVVTETMKDEAWYMLSEAISSELKLTLHAEIHDTVETLMGAVDAWYIKESKLKRVGLRDEMTKARIMPNEKVSEFYHRLNNLFIESKFNGDELKETEKIHHLMRGIGNKFPEAMSYIRMSGMTNVEEIVEKLKGEESSHELINIIDDSDEQALFAGKKRNWKPQNKTKT